MVLRTCTEYHPKQSGGSSITEYEQQFYQCPILASNGPPDLYGIPSETIRGFFYNRIWITILSMPNIGFKWSSRPLLNTIRNNLLKLFWGQKCMWTSWPWMTSAGPCLALDLYLNRGSRWTTRGDLWDTEFHLTLPEPSDKLVLFWALFAFFDPTNLYSSNFSNPPILQIKGYILSETLPLPPPLSCPSPSYHHSALCRVWGGE